MTQLAHQTLQAILTESERQLSSRGHGQLERYFPESGPLSRQHYAKFIRWFAAGAQHRERLLLAANRVGKSDTGCYELTSHLTGLYPDWWRGRRFVAPVRAWACGDTSKTVRDILEPKLIGARGARGTGFIPAHLIEHTTSKHGLADATETVWVRHTSAGISELQLKSYDQRREAYQGTAQHVILLDEEPPLDIYAECLLRTARTPDHPGGIVMLTFTPLQGLTPLVLQFLPGGTIAS